MVVITKKNCLQIFAASVRVISATTGNPPQGGFPLFAKTTHSEYEVLASSQNNFLSSHLNEHRPIAGL